MNERYYRALRTLSKRSLLALGLALVALLMLGAWFLRQRRAQEQSAAPQAASGFEPVSGYAGSAACRGCHEKEYAAWRDSHHARAERAVEPARDAEALVEAAKVGGASAERWIGVAPLEQLLLPRGGGRLQAFDVARDTQKHDWFSIFGQDARQPGDWGHWTGRGMNWNASCAYCHNTALDKGYQPHSDSYATSFAELGVGCEACHGPSRAHAEAPNAAPARHIEPARALDVCGSCHARRAELTGNFAPGQRFDDHFALEIPGSADVFYADGQVRDEAYELTAFLGSRMAHAGVGCSDCHDQHSGKTKAAGNALCLGCHATGDRNSPRIEPERHSFHAAASAGDACVNCHMPETTYMQRHARRDHGFTIPDPRLTVEHAVPNACTRCHADKPATWAVTAVRQRYGQGSERAQRAHARTTTVARGRAHEPRAKPELLQLLREEPVAQWRAVAASLLQGYAADADVQEALVAAVRDPQPVVRSHALQALDIAHGMGNLPLETALRGALGDPVRSVRVAAAWALRAEVPEGSGAFTDLSRYLELGSDQPLGQLQLGHFWLARGQAPRALQHFEKAARWDAGSAALQHELAVALSRAGHPREAVAALEQAVRLEPKEPRYAYALGLAQNEVGELSAAITAFERAVALDPRFTRAWYNLGLARDHHGDSAGALKALAQAEVAAPGDPDVARARAIILAHGR